jgi:hypothetical protein
MTRRILIGGAIALVLLLVIAQLVLPGYAANRIHDRLTEGGGTVSVTVKSFPAARLIFGDGDELRVSGDGLDLPLDRGEEVFNRLDGFDRVDVHLDDFNAGPFAIASFALTREEAGDYRLVTSSTTTASDLVGYGADELGIPGSGFLQYLTGRATGNRPIPIHLDMGLESDEGRLRVVSGGGTVAGYPAGPLAELITAAIVVRL